MEGTVVLSGIMSRRKFREEYIQENGRHVLAPPDTHNRQDARRIFIATLSEITNAASRSLGRTVTLSAISQPRHFNDSTSEILAHAAIEVEPSFQPMQLIKSSTAVWLAYNFTSCAAFGLSTIDCDIEEDLHDIMTIQYHSGYLEVAVISVDAATVNVVDHLRFFDLGESVIEEPASYSWVNWLLQVHRDETLSQRIANHYIDIEEKLHAFIEKQRLSADDFDRLDCLRAVVFSGDASESGFKSLRVATSAALGSHKSKIRDDLDPHYVEALGAGQRGRHALIVPGFVVDDHHANVRGVFSYHDEL